jgi:penicillin amidase
MATLTTDCRRIDPNFRLTLLSSLEPTTWRLVRDKPLHLLHPNRPSWDEFLQMNADELLDDLKKLGPDLAARTWGEANTVALRHPFGQSFPALGRWLDIPAQQLPGGRADTPRVQGRGFGASQRMAVSPGKEAQGYFHMPGGQSAHPWSPHYRDGHAAWAEGRATPFLPGETVHVLTLTP